MSDLKYAANLALEHIEGNYTVSAEDAIKALRQAIAEAEKQEPVGQLLEDVFGRGQVMWFNKPKDESMLYTYPQPRKPVKFPTMIRKMWSGSEVQDWLDENVNKE